MCILRPASPHGSAVLPVAASMCVTSLLARLPHRFRGRPVLGGLKQRSLPLGRPVGDAEDVLDLFLEQLFLLNQGVDKLVEQVAALLEDLEGTIIGLAQELLDL